MDGLIFDAACTALVERAADAVEAQDHSARVRGWARWRNARFSPGYGDWGLAAQRGLLAALDAQRQLGLTLTSTCLLVPTKSVTAALGLFDTPQATGKSLCPRPAPGVWHHSDDREDVPWAAETTLIRRGRQVRVVDEHLARVLAGEDFLLLDGAMGTQLQHAGRPGQPPELSAPADPDLVTRVHRRYVEAGSEMVMANTFGANRLKLEGRASVEGVYAAAIGCARRRAAPATWRPTWGRRRLLRPLGTLSFDEAYELYAEQVRAAAACGADAFVIETLSDLAEMKAAVLACREQADLPIFATMTFGEDGRTFLGTTPEVAAVSLGAFGVDVLGVNCSLGPAEVLPLVERMLRYAPCPVAVKPNAGLPRIEDGRAVYDISAEEFCAPMRRMLELGVTVIGACCGSGPSIIAGERRLLDAVGAPRPRVAGVTAPTPGRSWCARRRSSWR